MYLDTSGGPGGGGWHYEKRRYPLRAYEIVALCIPLPFIMVAGALGIAMWLQGFNSQSGQMFSIAGFAFFAEMILSLAIVLRAYERHVATHIKRGRP